MQILSILFATLKAITKDTKTILTMFAELIDLIRNAGYR